ncbi:MAG: ABC transporter permease [Lachnospiraceae bacterium]|nr:ABC transporter permease [Lachnospiraceae bacterium]
MKNPLRKRFLRELKSEFGKYVVIFLLLTGSIGFVSGFLVADGSMIIAYQESFQKYNIEDGNFKLSDKANKSKRKAIESHGITLYDNFYVEEALTNESTLRIYKIRDEINKACLMEGRMPKTKEEIAIDRMYAQNNQINIGDKIKSKDRTYQVTGLVALSDYSCLFSNNNDSMFDAVKFGVAVVTEEEFQTFDADKMTWCYSWKYENAPADETEEKEMADDLMEAVYDEADLTEFIPCYLNQAIQFTGDDMGSDKAMMIVLLYIIIVIMAFVFSVTISNTITKEASVIGTLRASGYSRGELLRHYLTLPLIVTLIGAAVGNLLGYTVFKNLCAGMYYGSYSLPTYVTIWSGEAFFLTTVIPFVIMLLVNIMILQHQLKLSPLKFLRHDFSRKKQRRAVRLHRAIPFFARFRIRVIFQNMSNYCVLFAGIVFANLLLLFGFGLPAVLSSYQQEIKDQMLCNYQYILQVPASVTQEDSKLKSLIAAMNYQRAVETENEDAEKFSAYSLETTKEDWKTEEILLYGVKKDSKFVPIETKGSEVYVSTAYADKYGLTKGSEITLKEPYEDTTYTFEVKGTFYYPGGLSVFMSQTELNRIFDLDEDYFSGYFSDTEITDIDEEYISSVIDFDALTKISRQLDVSMGGMMNLVNGFAIGIFIVLIYLLSKIIIEKNGQSISMAKILGYTNGEISRLYIVSTSIVVVVFLVISIPADYYAMEYLFKSIMMTSMTGWITFYVPPVVFIKMFLTGVLTYGIVALLEYRKVKRVPMDEALKNVE